MNRRAIHVVGKTHHWQCLAYVLHTSHPTSSPTPNVVLMPDIMPQKHHERNPLFTRYMRVLRAATRGREK
jgi:hypothetical protein